MWVPNATESWFPEYGHGMGTVMVHGHAWGTHGRVSHSPLSHIRRHTHFNDLTSAPPCPTPPPPTLYQGISTMSCCMHGGGSQDHTRSPSCSAENTWRPSGWKAMARTPVASVGVDSISDMLSRSHSWSQRRGRGRGGGEGGGERIGRLGHRGAWMGARSPQAPLHDLHLTNSRQTGPTAPHLDGLVGGTRPQEVLHRVEVQAGDGVRVASQLTQLLVGHQVPDLSGDQVWESMGTGDLGYRCQVSARKCRWGGGQV